MDHKLCHTLDGFGYNFWRHQLVIHRHCIISARFCKISHAGDRKLCRILLQFSLNSSVRMFHKLWRSGIIFDLHHTNFCKISPMIIQWVGDITSCSLTHIKREIYDMFLMLENLFTYVLFRYVLLHIPFKHELSIHPSIDCFSSLFWLIWTLIMI